MKFGFITTEGGHYFKQALEEAIYGEELGFDSVWLEEHHSIRNHYWPSPLMALAGIATRTSRVLLGTDIVVLPFYHPVRAAEDVAMLDLISNGRAIFGAAIGYRPPEFELYDVSLDDRGARYVEMLKIMRALWTQDRVDYSGRFFNIKGNIEPRPTRPIPIWLGGWGKLSLKRAAQLGDAWVPGPTANLEKLLNAQKQYRGFLKEAGKDPAQVPNPITREVVIADTSPRAWELAEKYVMVNYRDEYGGGWKHPLIGSQDSTPVQLEALSDDRFIIGNPAECIIKIKRFIETFGMDHLICRLYFAGMPHEHIMQELKVAGHRSLSGLSLMDDVFPALNHTLSPYTGWVRAHWEALLARLTYGYMRAADRSGSPARALFPDDRRALPDSVDALEAFARISSAWGAWLHNPSNSARLHYAGRAIQLEDVMRQALVEGTDSRNPHTYWGDMDHMSQHIVEAANLGVSIWLSRERVFNKLNEYEQAQVMAWLAQVDGKRVYFDNWILFPAMAQIARLKLGYPVPLDDLDSRLEQMAAFYRGEGWYADGAGDEFELYNPWMFHWHYLLWAWIDGDRRPDHRDLVLERSRAFLDIYPYFFGANGAYPAWGRSMVYRFAAIATFAAGHLLNIAPTNPGLLRRLSSGCIRYFYDREMFDPEEHYLRQGFHGAFPPAGESYISPGSVYWACHGLFALAFDRDDPFWTAKEEPLPVEQGDFDLALPSPGFALSGRRATGQVFLLNSRSGQRDEIEPDAGGGAGVGLVASNGLFTSDSELKARFTPRHDYPTKYGKLVYSTHFPFNVAPVPGSYAPDAMLALTHDGVTFGHRSETRRGGVAPGRMWCEFDERLNGQPQKVRVAIVLCRDIQIRLAYIQPTFPVRAFEAPGTLGGDGGAGIIRRSDPQAGWEYAEVDERALAIKRLWGYDGQCVSAPFFGYSNINLAYRYSEFPMVCETQASETPRELASASLLRPAPFDPMREFEGLEVTVAANGLFQLTTPDGQIIEINLRESTSLFP